MNPFMYDNPTRLLFGKGQVEQIKREIPKYGKKVLLVYGGGSIKQNGIYEQVSQLLEEASITWVELAGVEPNPRVSTIRKGIALCQEEQVDFVLAVGGGSVIDATKAIVVGAKSDADIWDIITRKTRATVGLPYGSILTMAGTGAEMSINAVISNWEEQDKRAWASSFARAKFAIVDPNFTKTVPRNHTLYGIVDAMSHILEHYFHQAKNTPIQDQFFEGTLRTLIDVAPKLLADLENENHRETVAFASTIALSDQLNMGIIGDWGTHHIEHALSAIFDIPHGGGLAILFPNWMRYVLDEQNAGRFKQLAVNVFLVEVKGKTEVQIAQEGIDRLAALWASWGAPTKLMDYDVSEDALEQIAKRTLQTEPNCGNFKRLTEKDVLAILKNSL